jgi:predicted methyltransferase
MRVAIPVRQVDGEFILTMQDMGLVAAVQPAAAAAAPAAAANGTAPAVLAPAKRQDSNTDKYGQVKPAQNAVIMTMKMVDDMVNAVTWGGQPGITQMMSEYVKAQTGNDLPKITV